MPPLRPSLHRLYRSLPILISILLAGLSGFWTLNTYQSVFAYRSPLQNQAPLPGEALGKPLPRQVVFVLIDALRYDTSLDGQVMPVLNGLRQQGATARMNSRPPSYSQPGYATLLTGAWPDLNDGPAVNVDGPGIWSFTQDNLFSAAKRAGLTSAISGYDWFQRLVPQDALSASFYTHGEDNSADLAVLDAALPWLQEGRYNLVLIHIDQVDYAGHHEGGPRSPAWAQAAARADSLLGEIIDAVDLSQDVVLICSDHGQIDRGGHGGQDPITLVEPFVLVGKGIHPGAGGDLRMIDVAPTLAVLLGTNLPASAEGLPQLQLLDLAPSQIAAAQNAVLAQQNRLVGTYRDTLGAPATLNSTDAVRDWRLTRERAQRFWPVLLAALLSVLCLVLRRPRGWVWQAGAAFVAVVVFHLYYGVIEGRTYSLSSVDGLQQLLSTVAVGSLLGFVAGLFTQVIIARLRKIEPGSIAHPAGYLLFMQLFMGLPILWSLYRSGWQMTWTLPEISSTYYGLLAGFQLVFTTIWALLAAIATAIYVRWGFPKFARK